MMEIDKPQFLPKSTIPSQINQDPFRYKQGQMQGYVEDESYVSQAPTYQRSPTDYWPQTQNQQNMSSFSPMPDTSYSNAQWRAMSKDPSPYSSNFTTPSPPTTPAMAGIGAAFETGDGRGLFIHSFIPGGPAESCGVLQKGDELVAVNGISVIGMSAKELAQILVGPVGTKVRVGFTRTPPGTRIKQHVNVEMIRQSSKPVA